MKEPKVITIGDVMDSIVTHINKGNPLFVRESKGNPHGTQGEPSNTGGGGEGGRSEHLGDPPLPLGSKLSDPPLIAG